MTTGRRYRVIFAILWTLLFLFLFWLTIASAKIFVFTKKAENLINHITPYEQIGNGKPDILVLGDSIAFGTGSSSPDSTIAGFIGQRLPQAKITNKSKNGTKTKTLLNRLETDIDRYYDVIIIIVGANDIMHPEVNLSHSKQNLYELYKFSTTKAGNVVIITTTNFDDVTFFTYPINYYFGQRSQTLAQYAFKESLKYPNIHYINTISDENSPNLPQALEADDHLHLNDLGAYYWTQKIFLSTNNLEF